MPNGYEFVRCNSIDTVVCPPNSSSVIFSPFDYPKVGPIREFATTDSFVFLHTLGRKPRNLFAGDAFEEIDDSIDFYFIIATRNDSVAGPFSFAQFQNHADTKSAAAINWRTPQHPIANFVFWLGALCTSIPLLLVVAVVWFTFKKANKAKIADEHELRALAKNRDRTFTDVQ